MSIKAEPNPSYVNGTSANDKYNPIMPDKLGLVKSDHVVLSKMLTNRIELLEYSGYKSSSLSLQLAVKNKDDFIKSLKNKPPPFVAISSGRAEWIRLGLANANAILRDLHPGGLTGIMDLRALSHVPADRKGFPSPPIYSPQRLGKSEKRNVYVFVHLNEYKTYSDKLAPYKEITVVGWNFLGLPLPKQASETVSADLVGFGASRFAAIEFCKKLYELSGNTTKLAWHFDDNVVGLSSGFGGLEHNEKELGTYVCQGFAGLPANQTRNWIIEWAKRGGMDPRSKQSDNPATIFQQVVLWNIEFLAWNNMNFGLAYVASAEDVSLSRYLTVDNFQYWFADGVAILKETPSDAPDQNVAKAKRMFEGTFATLESSDLPGMPAVKLDVLVGKKTEKMSIRDFVRQLVTIGVKGIEDNRERSDRAACQAVEQITKTAIGRGFVDQAALLDTFKKTKVETVLRQSG